jgi:ferredoxin-nitrite reductase
LLKVSECLPVAIALIQAYLEGVNLYRKEIDRHKKPRLRQIFQQWGIDWYLDLVSEYLSFSLRRQLPISGYSLQSPTYQHLGIHVQQQDGRSYMGLVIPLGRLTSEQLRQLANLAEVYGDGTLRLTPWQNLLIPNILNSKITDLQAEISNLGLSYSSNHPCSALVACTGNSGCASSATDTKSHALTLAKYLEKRSISNSLNIHFTGCPKSCAQHTMGDITLLGTTIQKGDKTVEGYHVYIGKRDQKEKFGQLLYSNIVFDEIPFLIEQILQTEHTIPK